MEVDKDVIDKLGIKPFIVSDYLKDPETRRECLRVAIEEDSERDFDHWLCMCYEGLLKQRGELQDGETRNT